MNISFKYLIHKYQNNSFVKDVSKIVSGTLFGQGVVFGVSIILTRLYTPESFGIAGSFQSVVGIMWILATLRYDLALPIISEYKERVIVGVGAIILSIIFSLVLFCTIVIFIYLTDFNLGKYENLKPFYWTIPIGIFILSIFYIFNFFLIGERKFSFVSIAKAAQGSGMSIMQLALGFIYSNGLSLIIGYLFGYLLAISFQIKGLIKSIDKINTLISEGKIKEKIIKALYKNRKFPLLSTPASFANIASFQIPTLLLAVIYSPEIAGFFFLAQRVLGMPIDLITNSISQVFLGNSNEILKKDPKRMKNLFFRIAKIMAIIGFIPLLIIFWKGELIFVFIFGENWGFTGIIAGLLTIMYYLRMITTPLSQTLNILKKLKIQLYWDVARLISILSLFFIAWYFQIPIMTFIIIFSILMAFLYFIHAFLSYHYITIFSGKSL